MKKQICAFFFVLTAAAAFGADFSLSAGAGGILGGAFTRYTLSADGVKDDNHIKIDATQEMNQFNYGFYAFIDASYGIFSVFFQDGVNDFTETANIEGLNGGQDWNGKGWESVFGFSILGKYPFKLDERLILFPLLGFDYRISLSQRRTQPGGYVYDRTDGIREKDKDNKAYKQSDWNSMWINLGGGLDLFLTGNLFLRTELLYGFRLMTSYETKNLETMKSLSGDSNPKLSGLTSGPSLKIAAGWRFI